MRKKFFVPVPFLIWLNPNMSKQPYVNISRNKDKGKVWVSKHIDKETQVDYFSIPGAFITRFKLPVNIEVVQMELENYKQDLLNPKADEKAVKLQEAKEDTYYTLYHETTANFQSYYNHLKSTYALPVEKCREFAKKWAAVEWVLNTYSRAFNSLECCYDAWSRIFPGQYTSKHSFANFLKACKDNGIEATIIDKRAVQKVQKRISDFQYAFMQKMYTHANKFSRAYAHKELIKACKEIGETPCSLGTVKIYFKEFENNIELYALRHGQTAAQKQRPFNSLLPAEHRNTMWNMDGWTLPFWGHKFQRYTLHFIIDNHSKKIIGYSIGKSENTVLILETLDDAMRNTGVLPAELVSDKHSFHTTDIAKRFRTETERMGMIWTVTTNAQRNAPAERYNQYLNEYCQQFKGYLGKGVTAKSPDARLSDEHYTELTKSKNWLTEEEIKAIAVYAVEQYNNAPSAVAGGYTPNEKYEQSQSVKAFAIDEQERVRLIRPIDTYIVRRGQITIKVGVVKHEFQLPAELITRYNNQKVQVVYEDLAQGIYLFDVETGHAIGSIEPKVKIHSAITDQTDKDRKLMQQMAGRSKGTIVQARKKADERIIAALRENPEAIELINNHSQPKDIRRIAEQDYNLKLAMREKGINENMMPIRAQEPVTARPAAAEGKRTGKDINSPFMPENNEMKLLTEDDLKNLYKK